MLKLAIIDLLACMFCFPNSDHVMFSREFSGVPSRGLQWKKHKRQKGLLCIMSVLLQQARTSSISTSVPGSLFLPPPGMKEKRRDPGNKVGTIHFPVGAAVCRLHYHHMMSYKRLER